MENIVHILWHFVWNYLEGLWLKTSFAVAWPLSSAASSPLSLTRRLRCRLACLCVAALSDSQPLLPSLEPQFTSGSAFIVVGGSNSSKAYLSWVWNTAQHIQSTLGKYCTVQLKSIYLSYTELWPLIQTCRSARIIFWGICRILWFWILDSSKPCMQNIIQIIIIIDGNGQWSNTKEVRVKANRMLHITLC